MKALAKERSRRYESAIGLANDIERFQNHEPVTAGPPSSTYRLKKFARRHRVQVIAASLVLMALIGGVVGTTLGLIEARKQASLARRESGEKDKARKAAERQLAMVERSNEILSSVFLNLNPKAEKKDDRPLSERLGRSLDQATAQLEGDAIGDPLAVARMQNALGVSQVGLGYAQKAIVLLTRARATFLSRLGPDHRDTLMSMDSLAGAYHSDGRNDLALALYEQTLTRRKATLGPDHADTLVTMSNLAVVCQAAGKLTSPCRYLRKPLYG